MQHAADNSLDDKVIFYHAPCPDGAAAAFAAYEKFGDRARYVPVNHGPDRVLREHILSNINENSDVYFLDWAPTRALLEDALDKTSHITICDHHMSAVRDLAGLRHERLTAHFDNSYSGGMLAWRMFHAPNIPRGRPAANVPLYVSLTQIVDLEQTQTHGFYEIAAYIDAQLIDNIDQIIRTARMTGELTLSQIVMQGKALRQYQSRQIDKLLHQDRISYALVDILPNYPAVLVPMINGDIQSFGREVSIRLQKLAEDTPPADVALLWHEDGDIIRVSVRSYGKIDAGRVAEHLASPELGHGVGGGGHAKVAAARFTRTQFEKRLPRLASLGPMVRQLAKNGRGSPSLG